MISVPDSSVYQNVHTLCHKRLIESSNSLVITQNFPPAAGENIDFSKTIDWLTTFWLTTC